MIARMIGMVTALVAVMVVGPMAFSSGHSRGSHGHWGASDRHLERGEDYRSGGHGRWHRGGEPRRATIWCTDAAVDYYACGQGWSCGFLYQGSTIGCVWPKGCGPVYPRSSRYPGSDLPQPYPEEPKASPGTTNGAPINLPRVQPPLRPRTLPNRPTSPAPSTPRTTPTPPRSLPPVVVTPLPTPVPRQPAPPTPATTGYPWCNASATGRFSCGDGLWCGYPNGNTETACQYR